MMISRKTTPSLVLPSHPLAKGLVGCWLLNEGSGGVVLDSSGHGLHLTHYNGPAWVATEAGPAVQYDDAFSQYSQIDRTPVASAPLTMNVWFVPTDLSVNEALMTVCTSSSTGNWWFLSFHGGSGLNILAHAKNAEGTASGYAQSTVGPTALGQLCMATAVFDSDSSRRAYFNGGNAGSDATAVTVTSAVNRVCLGRMGDGSPGSYASCHMVAAMLYNRALTASEIARLYRDPFAFLQKPGLWTPVAASGLTHDLGGSITVSSSLSAIPKVLRNVSASLNPTSSVSGALSGSSASPEPVLGNVKPWRSGVLCNGLTPAASRLGTVLTGGWFWTRRAGCSALYRGPSLADVDFDVILSVVDRDAQQVSVPTHLSHEPGSSHCYVVRRFNSVGDPEQTTSAAALVRIGADGRLAGPAPNPALGLNATPVSGHRVRLLWCYSSLNQQIAPEGFNVYWDCGNGQIDFTEPLALVPYQGPKCHGYVSDSLTDGVYRFAVRAVGADQAECMSLSSVRCPIQTGSPQATTILTAEAIP